jgi:hypothetical protein
MAKKTEKTDRKTAAPSRPDRSGLKKLDHNHLAEGEVTGHYHAAVGDGVELYDRGDGLLVLDAPNGAAVTHQEHETFGLEGGSWTREIVREMDHEAEQVRNVLD